MSWDIDLAYTTVNPDYEAVIGAWDYTHNCNRMIETVLAARGIDPGNAAWWAAIGHRGGLGRGSWWKALDGKSAIDGAAYLDVIVGGLAEAPGLFREMNPPNGWGDYDCLLNLLTEIRDRARAHPEAVFHAHG